MWHTVGLPAKVVKHFTKINFAIFFNCRSVISLLRKKIHKCSLRKISLLRYIFIYVHRRGWIIWESKIIQPFKPHPIFLILKGFTLLWTVSFPHTEQTGQASNGQIRIFLKVVSLDGVLPCESSKCIQLFGRMQLMKSYRPIDFCHYLTSLGR